MNQWFWFMLGMPKYIKKEKNMGCQIMICDRVRCVDHCSPYFGQIGIVEDAYELNGTSNGYSYGVEFEGCSSNTGRHSFKAHQLEVAKTEKNPCE